MQKSIDDIKTVEDMIEYITEAVQAKDYDPCSTTQVHTIFLHKVKSKLKEQLDELK